MSALFEVQEIEIHHKIHKEHGKSHIEPLKPHYYNISDCQNIPE